MPKSGALLSRFAALSANIAVPTVSRARVAGTHRHCSSGSVQSGTKPQGSALLVAVLMSSTELA